MISSTSKLYGSSQSSPSAEQSPTVRPPFGQRVFDLVITIPFLILLLPIFVATMVWVKMDSRGPVFFLQRRVGRFGRTFLIVKFRTMIADAERTGAQITIGDDPRITRCGHFLRKYRIDELPQLFNIIKGEMSLVGPRPEVPRYVECYTEEQRSILALRPGITSPASIAFINESELLALHPSPEQLYRFELIPAKIERDLEYARRATVWSDGVVIVKTFRRVVLRTRIH